MYVCMNAFDRINHKHTHTRARTHTHTHTCAKLVIALEHFWETTQGCDLIVHAAHGPYAGGGGGGGTGMLQVMNHIYFHYILS